MTDQDQPQPKQELIANPPAVSKLYAALARAQGKITEPELDKTNPHFGSKYASLASVWKACRTPLSSEGLCVVQGLEYLENKIILRTRLIHESGQEVSFLCPVLTNKSDMQGLGGTITYARRYSLNALIGTSGEEDDDGNSASGKDPKKGQQQQQQNNRNPPPRQQQQTQQAAAKWAPNEAQLKRMFAIGKEHGWEHDHIKQLLTEKYGIESSKQIASQDHYESICKELSVDRPKSPIDDIDF